MYKSQFEGAEADRRLALIDSINEQLCPKRSGTLPLTIDSIGGNLSDWTIYGNTEGVGEKTKNLIDYSDIDATQYGIRCYRENDGVHVEGTYTETDAKASTYFRRYCYLEAGTYTLSGSTNYTLTGYQLQIGTCRDASGSNYRQIGYDKGSDFTFILQEASYVGVRIYIATSATGKEIDAVMPIMLRKADTTPDFIPYGYQIPLDIRSENNEKHMDIYIGDSPLTEGQSVSRKSTGIEIEVEQGTSIISTTLTNKPEMNVVPDSYEKLKEMVLGGAQ